MRHGGEATRNTATPIGVAAKHLKLRQSGSYCDEADEVAVKKPRCGEAIRHTATSNRVAAKQMATPQLKLPSR
jgi:hypothetical protein